MDKILKDANDHDYTIVLDPNYAELEKMVMEQASEPEETKDDKDGSKAEIDRMYAEYEVMCLKEPTILDLDDAYPHSYQWRVGDKYDPAKIEVLKAALREGKRITDTEAYQEYVEDMKSRKFEPASWE